MKKKSGLFVKINYKNEGNTFTSVNNDTKSIKQNDLQLGKYLLCGGTYNKSGGTIIFQARDIEEANSIATNNPFIKYNTYRYEILKGDVIAL